MGLAQTEQRIDLRQLKQEIIEYSRSIGIDKIGFASADPFDELKQRLLRHRELGYESGFEEPDIDKRTTPTKILPEAKSIIAIALAYPSRLKNPPRSRKGAYRGILCRASWGLDYHHILRDKLIKLEAFIKSKVPDARCESMVDTGALSDRAVAERAGIGWSGKNTAIITKEFGSWVYLGEMLTSIPFEPDQPVTESCGSCTKCLDACPTGALVQPGQLDSTKCLAYLTQVKNFVPAAFREKMGNRLYGCDTCQVVCPVNHKKNFTHHPEMEPDPEVAKPLLKPLLRMSKREFREKFGPTSSAWRGKKPLQRNAIIALGNFKDESAVPELIDLLHNDPRPAIRGTAAWALGKIGTEEGRQALEEANRQEQDEQVLAEIEQALGMFEETHSPQGRQ
ncbi:epoxyqueuosine reductase [Caldalkalibacillus thermarum]|nr:epoxyqueuosine reductase [Caldalkalibacillus thermarum]